MLTGQGQGDTKDAGGDQPQLSAPAISLPKGGGAIRGIGEKFAANPVTGTGSMTVPIATSPGRSGFDPELSLSYDSGAGNGPLGFGWSLSLPSITRKTDKGLPQYFNAEEFESDVFILTGTEDLVPVLTPDRSPFKDITTAPGYTIHRYRPRIEGLFARIERWTNEADSSDMHWRSISKDNILTIYGKDANSRIADPENPGRIFSWLICETRDDKGNAVLYEYKPEDGTRVDLSRAHERNRGDRNDPRRTVNRYLKRIRYGNRLPLLDTTGQRPRWLTATQIQNAGWLFEVVFDYGEHAAETPIPDDAGQWTYHDDHLGKAVALLLAGNNAGQWVYRDDPFSSYRAGFEVRTYRLCQRVLMFHHISDLPTGEKGYDGLVRSTDFTYTHEQDPTNAHNPVYTFLLAVTQSGYKRHDDGYLKHSLPPVEFEYSQPIVQGMVEEVEAESLANLPVGLDGAAYQWTDLHGEGIPGILTEQAGVWFYKRNLSPINVKPVDGAPHVEAKFAPVELVATKPNLALDALVWQDLCRVLSQPALITHELERAQMGEWLPQALHARRHTLRDVLAQLERQQARLLEVYLAEVIGRDEFERKRKEVTHTQHGLQQQLRQLDAQAPQHVHVAALAQGIEAFCRRMQPTLDNATFAQRSQLVELLIDRVIVNDAQVEIRSVVPTGPKGETTPFCHVRLDYFDAEAFLIILDRVLC